VAAAGDARPPGDWAPWIRTSGPVIWWAVVGTNASTSLAPIQDVSRTRLQPAFRSARTSPLPTWSSAVGARWGKK